MTPRFTRVMVAVLWGITFGLVAIYSPQSGLGNGALMVFGLIAVSGLIAAAIVWSAGLRTWSVPGHRRRAAAALAASDAIDLERFDSDKG